MWDYPSTKIGRVQESRFGHVLIDNYRWLENRGSKRVAVWTAAQNAFTRQILNNATPSDRLENELKRALNTGSAGMPVRVAD